MANKSAKTADAKTAKAAAAAERMERAAAAPVPASTKFTRIRINNVDAGGSTPVAINGEVRRIPHNSEAVVDEYELEVLENSHVDITVVGPATKAQADKAGAAARSRFVDEKAAPYEQPLGGDYLPKPPPEDELDVRASAANMLGGEPYEQPRGGDYLLKTPDTPLAPSDEDREAAIERRDAYEAGDMEPVVELTNIDPHQTKLQAAGGPIEADTSERGSGIKRPATPKAETKATRKATKATRKATKAADKAAEKADKAALAEDGPSSEGKRMLPSK